MHLRASFIKTIDYDVIRITAHGGLITIERTPQHQPTVTYSVTLTEKQVKWVLETLRSPLESTPASKQCRCTTPTHYAGYSLVQCELSADHGSVMHQWTHPINGPVRWSS